MWIQGWEQFYIYCVVYWWHTTCFWWCWSSEWDKAPVISSLWYERSWRNFICSWHIDFAWQNSRPSQFVSKDIHWSTVKRFNIQSCSPSKTSIMKGGQLLKAQCPRNGEERYLIKVVPYLVGGLVYMLKYYAHDLT